MPRHVSPVPAVVGAILPMRDVLAGSGSNGVDLGGLVAAWHANAAASGLAPRRALLSVAAIFGIGLSCGLPRHLCFRSGPQR